MPSRSQDGDALPTRGASPLVLVLFVLGLIAAGGGAARSTVWSPRQEYPLVRRRASGQILRTALVLYRRHRRTLFALGALFVPAAIVESVAQEFVTSHTRLGAFVDNLMSAPCSGRRVVLERGREGAASVPRAPSPRRPRPTGPGAQGPVRAILLHATAISTLNRARSEA